MKSERRHELQRNELADWIAHSLGKVRPYLRMIFVGLAVVLVVLGFVAILVQQQSASVAQGWRDYLRAGSDAAVLRDVANRHEGKLPGLWAQQSLADSELAMGMTRLFSDRDEANQSLEIAKEAYLEIIEKAGRRHAMLRRRAQFGLAQTYEALSEPEKAIEMYDEVIKEAGGDAIAAAARRRMQRVQELQQQEFYQWFASAEPPPPGSQQGMLGGMPPGMQGRMPQGMQGGMPPGMQGGSPFGQPGPGADLPGDLLELPESPDMSLPGTRDEAPLPSTGPMRIPVQDEEAPQDAPSDSQPPQPDVPVDSSDNATPSEPGSDNPPATD